MFVHVTSKKGPCILHVTQIYHLLKAISIFILSGNLLLREIPFHIANCLTPVDFTLFFVYTLKLLKGPL